MTPINTSHSKPVIAYPTPLLQDVEVITTHDARLADYRPLDYGTPYPDQVRFPGLKLIHQEPINGEDRTVRRIWAADRQNQDSYNADRKYSGGSTEHPILIRRYLFPEEDYTPLNTGTPDSQFPEAILVEEEVTQPENRNGYLAVTRVFETVPGPLLTGKLVTDKGQVATITTQVVAPGTTVTPSALTVSASVKPNSKGKSVLEKVEVAEVFPQKSFSVSNPDPVPEKFRIAVPAFTEEETEAGTSVSAPVLGVGEIEKSEEQLTAFTRRKRKTSRSTTALPKTLTQTATTNEGIKAAISETLQTGDTTANPTAKVSIESEAMGDGTYVVRTTTLPEVFPAKSLSVENPDPVPEKFRIAVPATTTEQTEEGSISNTLTLAPGELSKSEQQVTKHTRRTRKTSRSRAALPKTLKQVATSDEQQIQFVDETLQVGDTTRIPSVTVDVQSEAQGDGSYVVRTADEVEILPQPSYTAEFVDNTPQKFRSQIAIRTEERTEVGIARKPELSAGEISKSYQQIDKFKVRKRTVKRAPQAYPININQVSTNEARQSVSVVETLQLSNPEEQPSATTTVESEAVGPGMYVVRKTTVPEVFSELTKELDRGVEVLPERFRAAIPQETVSEIVEGDVSTVLSLEEGEVSKSESQLTKFTKRKKISKQSKPASNVLLRGQLYDEVLNKSTPYTERVYEGKNVSFPDAAEVTPLSDTQHLVRRFDVVDYQKELENIHYEFPTQENIRLPDRLLSAKAIFSRSFGRSDADGGGNQFTIKQEVDNEVRGELLLEIEQGYSGSAPATVHVFFIPAEDGLQAASIIASKTQAKPWPKMFLKTRNVVLGGMKLGYMTTRSNTYGRNSSWASGSSTSQAALTNVVTIPPVLCSDIPISVEYRDLIAPAIPNDANQAWLNSVIGSLENSGNYNSANELRNQIVSGFQLFGSLAGTVTPPVLSASNPPKMPEGKFLYSSDVSLYKYGMLRVAAVVVDTTGLYSEDAQILVLPVIQMPVNGGIVGQIFGFVNRNFSFQIQSVPKADTYGAIGLPKSLKLDVKTGRITGKLTASDLGITAFSIRATNAKGTGIGSCILNVLNPPS